MYRVWCVLRQSSSILRSTVTVSGSPRFLSTYTSINVDALSPRIKQFVEDNAKICQPDNIYVCDGSNEENTKLIEKLQQDGRLDKLTKYDNCYLARTSKEDVARVEKQTYICSEKVEDAVPIPKSGNHEDSRLGHWKAPSEMDKELSEKFTGCMKGRTMYIIPFSMGPVGSPLSKYGIQLTDSEYVVASMRIMTRMGKEVLDTLGNDEFVKCLHSVGAPILPGKEDTHWPCNPKNIAIAHFPERNEIKSYGSGYGGNSLLGKKCFALRIATILARREGWLAEHMLILGLTNPEGRKKYIAAAFPSQCGKTNLAMITPTLPGWKAECVGDDIAWMRFGADGKLRAINPENGFFGVAPGTNTSSNPNAMGTIFKDTIFTNVASTSDGGAYWKGLEDETPDGVSITSWLNEENWQDLSDEEKKKRPAAHPNSRFCAPAGNCPIIDPRWEDPEGVPIDAILFGGRRPTTVPLVFESFNWQHGVFVGASMRSKATSAAEHTGDEVMHDPFAMRPFYGYSFAQYMAHWLSLQQRPGVQLPKIFHVNWFRQSPTDGSFIWPGFGENCRVLDWIFRRCDNEDIAQPSPLGLIPKPGTLDITGLNMKDADIAALFDTYKEELEKEAKGIEEYFNDQLPGQVPGPVEEELAALKARIAKL